MAKKDDLQIQGGDLGLPLRQFLLGLSSELLDVVPSPGISFAQPTQPSDVIAINDHSN